MGELLVDAFLEALPEDVRARADRRAIRDVLKVKWEEGALAWPAVVLGSAPFGRHLAGVVREAPTAKALRKLKGPDLYLAAACLRSDRHALRALEALLAELPPRLGRMRLPDSQRQEVVQRVRHKLLVGAEGGGPALASYAGLGTLGAFLRVVAAREAISWLRAQGPQAEDGDLVLIDHEVPGAHPEVDYAKVQARKALSAALREALQALPAGERMLLRLHYVEEVTLERLAALKRVHRATLARRLQAAREAVLEGTRRALAEQLRLSPPEVESLLGLSRSQLELSLRRVLE